MSGQSPTKILLDERELPTEWYNIAADLPRPPAAILFALSGHGHFDLSAYDNYLAGNLQDYEYPEEDIREAITQIPAVNA